MISRERLKEIVREELSALTEYEKPTPLGASPAVGVWAAIGAKDMLQQEYNTDAAGLYPNTAGFKKKENWSDSRNTKLAPDVGGLPFEE